MRDETSLPHTDYITQAFDDNREMIDRIVIHSTVCTTQEAINTFSSPNATTSAHYIVGNNGSLWSGLEEWLVGYHSGNYQMNQRSIGIEHEWYAGIHPSEALYQKSAALVKDICTYYGLPINRTTVIGHKEVVPTGCPNEIDVDKIVQMAGGASNPIPPTADCPKELADLKVVEKILRDAITRKDDQIKAIYLGLPGANPAIVDPNSQIQFISDSFLNLTNALNSKEQELLLVAEQLKVCQSGQGSALELKAKLDKLQARYDKLKSTPAKAQISILFAIAEKLGVQL